MDYMAWGPHEKKSRCRHLVQWATLCIWIIHVLYNKNSLIDTCLCLHICRYGVLRQRYLEVVSAVTPSLVLQACTFLLIFFMVHRKTNRGNSCCSLRSRPYSVNTSWVKNNCILDTHWWLFLTAEIIKRHFGKVWGAKGYLPPQNLPRFCELWNPLSKYQYQLMHWN